MPDRFHIDKEDRSYYQKVVQENVVNFSKKNQKEQFLLAMAIGFENGQKRELRAREGFFFSKDLGEDRTLINSVAIHECGSADILADEKEVFQVAERYASAGIRILADSIEKVQFGRFDKVFEKELTDMLESAQQEG